MRVVSKELLAPETAKKLFRKIIFAIGTLDEMPMRHRLIDDDHWKEQGLRILPVENYLVFYIADERNSVVKIYRIIYGKRDIGRQLQEKVIFER